MSTPQETPAAPIGITMGCPAGIGPEIVLKHHQAQLDRPQSARVVIGDIGLLQETSRSLGFGSDIRPWLPGDTPAPGCLNVLAASRLAGVIPGRPTAATGAAMATYIERAISLCLAGSLAAITTCPISKTSLNQAGYDFPGHTEMLAQRSGAARVVMMMAGSKLRVTLATIHCALASVPGQLSIDSLAELIVMTHAALRNDFALARPRLAVAALNPHGGEDRLFGDEEELIIAPAVAQAAASGITVSGPHPADTVFYKAAAGQFDAVVCMYHDQGLIPFKLLHFSDGVNVTLGLPFIRTSVDHGTAYDIAGTGSADCSSLGAAVSMAAQISFNRRKQAQS